MRCIWLLLLFSGHGLELFTHLKPRKSDRISILISKADSVEEELNIADNIHKILHFKGAKNYMKFDFMRHIFTKSTDLRAIITPMKALLADNSDIRRSREVEVARFLLRHLCLSSYRSASITGNRQWCPSTRVFHRHKLRRLSYSIL